MKGLLPSPFQRRFLSIGAAIAALLLPGGFFHSSAQADDLIVSFEEVSGGVRLTINPWRIPDEHEAILSVSIIDRLEYQVSRPSEENPHLGLLSVTTGWEGRGVFLWEGASIDFSKLLTTHQPAISLGQEGGMRLLPSTEPEQEETYQGRFIFDTYHAESRLAVFNVNLLLSDVTFEDLFVADAFKDGPFTVWSSEHFSVKFQAVPEADTLGLTLAGGALLLLYSRRRLRWQSNSGNQA